MSDIKARTTWPRRGGSSLAEHEHHRIPASTQLIAFYLAYMLAAGFGRWMTVIPDIPIAVWPPNGVVLAMLLTQPRRTWSWWIGLGALGELTGNAIWYQNPLPWALGYAAANILGIMTAALLLGSRLRTPIQGFDTLRQVLLLLVIGVLGAPAISATFGSAIDALAGKNPFTTTWPIWWLGDATGILIALPLIVSITSAWHERANFRVAHIAEMAALAIVLVVASVWVLSTGATFAFLLPVPVFWAALRFEFLGATLAVLVLTLAIGVYAQTYQSALLSASEIALLHTKLQALILVTAATGLIVAAIIRQHRQACSDLARINNNLEALVAERTRAIEAAELRFKATFENAGVGIGILDGNGMLLRVNDSLALMLGRQPDEMEGCRIDAFTHPDDLAKGEEALGRLSTGEAEGYDLEKRYLHKDGQAVWGHTTVSCVRNSDGQIDYLIKVIQDITERKRSEAVRHILMREVNHRSKNLLSIVQVIARQTAAHSPHRFTETFGERLQALAANQDILVHNDWQRLDLTELVSAQLKHFETIAFRVRLVGPPVVVAPAAAQVLGMALHELATNAAKYGSLSNDSGWVEVSWGLEKEMFWMTWQERGGPLVTAPEKAGFGMKILDQLTASSLSGAVNISYATEGLIWALRCPLSALTAEGSTAVSV